MRTFFLLIVIFWNLNTNAQKEMKIEISELEPRVGENVTLSINSDFLSENLEKFLGNDIKLNGSTNISGLIADGIERIIIFNKVGINKVGPFEFNFNGEKYISNQIEVNVRPELKLEESLSIRIINTNGERFLIIEQVVKNIPFSEISEDGEITTYIHGGLPNNFEFVTVSRKFDKKIELTDKKNSSYTIAAEKTKRDEIGFTIYSESYKLKFLEEAKEEIIISEEYFINLPSKHNFKPITLKK